MTEDHLFGGLRKEFLDRLTEDSTPQRFEDDQILFLAGSEGETAYHLLEGSVRLYMATTEGKEVTVHMVKPGEIFAEVVLFEREDYPVNAVATGTVTVQPIKRRLLHQFLEDETFRSEFITNLVQKMRYLSDQLYVFAALDVEQRLLRFFRARYGGKSRFQIDMTKGDVAAAISVRPETLSRTIHSLQDRGILEWNGRTVTIVKTE